ncbi:universal stress protein [Hamadaea sp. NPDC051192]|uniref:universal stress protein n=1 Tax=Hamadaea sp. NPDC051192 TaxID=3154940 RepID=UPI0034200F6A
MTERLRVILGVHDSLSGLRALRRAVGEARIRAAELHAVRAWMPTAGGYYAPTVRIWESELDAAAKAEIRHAFDTAMGGLPRDVDLRLVTVQALPGPALVEYAYRDDDLLVVGVGRPGRLARLAGRGGTSKYCLNRALCPVLMVPPDRFATECTRVTATDLTRSLGAA